MRHDLVETSLKWLVSFLAVCFFLANCSSKKAGMNLATLGLANSGGGSDSSSSSKLVKKVTLGTFHSFIVKTPETPSELFVFGGNTTGQLGLGASPDTSKCNNTAKYCHTPVELTDSKIKGKIKKITLGGVTGGYSFIETKDGKLFVFGDNSQGQLGLGDNLSKNTPTELTVATITDASKQIARGNIKEVTLGGSHSFIETKDGKLFVFGDNLQGQLGLGASPDTSKCKTENVSGTPYKYCHTPLELTVATITDASKQIARGNVKKVTLGFYHSFIETTDGKLFVFGDNSHGQLGLGDNLSKNTPKELTVATITDASKQIARGNVKEVTLGGNRSFIETKDSKLFVFGENLFGQLGLGASPDTSKCKTENVSGIPYKYYCHTPLELIDSNIAGKVKKVTLGAYHSFIETTDTPSKLFVFGYNALGQLGLGDPTTVGTSKTSPTELTDTNIKGKVKQITLGGGRSFIETTDNKLFVFGWNSKGELGLGASPDASKCGTATIGGKTSKYCHTPIELVLP